MCVFPARAGMNRRKRLPKRGAHCVPRASGDEPTTGYAVNGNQTCSPRERG